MPEIIDLMDALRDALKKDRAPKKLDPYADLREVYEDEITTFPAHVTKRAPNPDHLDYETPTTKGGRTV